MYHPSSSAALDYVLMLSRYAPIHIDIFSTARAPSFLRWLGYVTQLSHRVASDTPSLHPPLCPLARSPPALRLVNLLRRAPSSTESILVASLRSSAHAILTRIMGPAIPAPTCCEPGDAPSTSCVSRASTVSAVSMAATAPIARRRDGSGGR